MKIDTNNMINKVKPQCKNINTYLSNASSYISSVSIPSDFTYYYKLTKMPQEINNIKSNINSINTWVSDVANKFEAAENKNVKSMNSLISKIDKINISTSFTKTGSKVSGTQNNKNISYSAVAQVSASTSKSTFKFEKIENMVNKIQSQTSKTAAKIGKFVCNFVIEPAKDIYEKCKAAISEFISGLINEMTKGINELKKGMTEFVNKGWKKACEIKDSVVNGLKDAGAYIGPVWDSLYTKVLGPVLNVLECTAASIVNVLYGLTKGLAQFVESVLDLVVIILTGVASIFTGLWDGVSYVISLFTGNKDEWSSATAAMWKGVMGYVAEDHVGNIFAAFYEKTIVGQWLDEHAIGIFKSDGIGTNIASGIGYVAGIIILTIVTLGAGGAAVGTSAATTSTFTTTAAVVATASGTGQYTEEAWGNMRDSSWEGIERMYEKGEITEEELNSFMAIRNLTDEQWAEIEKDYKNGVISKEEFEQIKQIKEMPDDWKTLENGIKGIGYGVANGVWEGVQWYVGGKLGNWVIKGGSQLATSAIRVGVDTAFNGVDTVFRTAMDTVTYGSTWAEAWQEQGGWNSVITSIGVGLITSVGGEVFDNIKAKGQVPTSDVIDESKKFIDDFNKKYPDSFDNGARKLQNAQQVAEYFSDPKGFLAGKFGVDDIRYMTDLEMYEYAKMNLGKEDFKAFENLYSNRRRFSQEEADLILAFSAAGGPAIDAYCRGVDVEFLGRIFEGGNYKEMNDYFQAAVARTGASSALQGMDIDDAVKMLDNIIENSRPLEESLIVTRYVDDVFFNDNKILNPQAGMIFNDKAFLSTSATGGTFANRKMKLEIEVPAGSKVAYIEPEAIAHTGFHQQEVLLGRNNMYQISDVRYDVNTGQYIVKAEMVPLKSKFQSIINYDIGKNNTQYYTNYNGKSTIKQIDLNDVISDMENKGLMAKYEAEVRDMKMSGIYGSAIVGHGEEHVEDVIFNAMYIAEKENFNEVDKKILIEAAKYHDAGKNVEGLLHGIQGAENAINYLSGFSADDVAIIQAAIEYHSIPDSDIRLNEIFDKYNVASADRNMAEKIANALKDADALDRSRYPGNLDEKYLRTDTAKTLIEASHQLQEIKGKQFLDNFLSGETTDIDRSIIEKLRENSVSDYEIAFWMQYNPSEVGGVIGVWNEINNKIRSILGG